MKMKFGWCLNLNGARVSSPAARETRNRYRKFRGPFLCHPLRLGQPRSEKAELRTPPKVARLLYFCGVVLLLAAAVQPAFSQPVILTPPAPDTPRINGPDVFGVRPGSPLLYTIPATGDRPMTFSVKNLPAGLKLDPQTGRITGSLPKAMPVPANAKGGYLLSHPAQALGNYAVTLV